MSIAVIGGGIVGATAAFYLSQDPTLEVTLIDRPEGQATQAAAGIISPWLSQRRNQDWYHLAKTGAAFYPSLIQALGLPPASPVYKQTGTLLFKKDRPLLEKLAQLAEQRRIEAPEIGEITLLTSDDITEKCPLLTPTQDALFITGGARVDGSALVTALKQGLVTNGGTYQEATVTGIKESPTGWLVTTDTGEAHYEQVILAMGAWLPDLLRPLGYDVDIRGQKGQLVELTLPQHTTDWPVIIPQGESDIIPFDGGKILVGATHENDQGYDLTVDHDALKGLISSVAHLAPALTTAKQSGYRIGTRAYSSDFLPFFGTVDGAPNLLVASGLGSSGLTTGPIIGKTLADIILKQPTSLPIEHYVPTNYIRKITKD